MKEKISALAKIILIIIIIGIIVFLFNVYKERNFNEYIRAEYTIGLSEFGRDKDIRYNNGPYSYKIQNNYFNDAMFYKTIDVKPNTPYKVSCMVKTQDVKNVKGDVDAGAHICISDTIEKSDNVVGTSEWTKLEFMFNSKNRKQVDVGFRLGGFEDNCTGTAWFTDIKIEEGVVNENNEWNFLCLIFDNVDVDIDNNGKKENVKLKLNNTDIYDITSSFRRFGSTIESLSRYKISANTVIKEINEPIKKMSHDEENGYYVSSYDIKNIIDKYIAEDKYDHIFVAFKTGDINEKKEIPINDWIGLGGMEYRNIGFSNIRIPSESDSYIYKFDYRVNKFPEEVFIHEFLHTLERNAKEYGYTRPELHSYEEYGYKSEELVRLEKWYADYMNSEIKTNQGNIGLPEEIFTKKPTKKSDFEYSHKLNYFKEPENIIEELNNMVFKIVDLFKEKEKIEITNTQI